MTDQAPWLLALDEAARAAVRVPLTTNAAGLVECRLRAPVGAHTLQVPLGLGAGLRVRLEVPVGADQRAALRLEIPPDGRLCLPGQADLRVLHPDGRDPPLPLPPPRPATRWQVALLLDATCHWHPPGPASGTMPLAGAEPVVTPAAEAARRMVGRLLDDPARRADLSGQLTGFLGALLGSATGGEYALIGFADRTAHHELPEDLKPAFIIRRPTGSGRFAAWDRDQARAHLAALPASSGGDWEDALAEALAAALRLPWADAANRLVVVFGDSPGHSITAPLRGAQALVRGVDVDLAAAALHARGIEILTLYHRPPVDFGAHAPRAVRELLAATAAQYRRLASSPAHALASDPLDPDALAELAGRLRSRQVPLARGVSLGWVDDDRGR